MNVSPSTDVFLAFDTSMLEFETALLKPLRTLLAEYGFSLVTFKDQIGTDETYTLKTEDQISNSAFVIADVGCTLPVAGGNCATNPNVALEVGLAIAHGKRVILLLNSKNLPNVASNLQGRDFCYFPECFMLASSELERLRSKLAELSASSLTATPVRIFDHVDQEYYTTLHKIESLPGPTSYMAPSFRAFFRPTDVDERWMREIRHIPLDDISRQLELRVSRRGLWLANVRAYGCHDIYSAAAIEESLISMSWRTMKLKEEEIRGFVQNLIDLLRNEEGYKLTLVDGPICHKFWIKELLNGGFVVLENTIWAGFTASAVGGIIFSTDDCVRTFKAEFGRVRSNCSSRFVNRDETIDWLQWLVEK